MTSDSELYNDIVEMLSNGNFLQLNGKAINLTELNEYINVQQDEIERLNNIINELEERCKFFNEMSNEKQNRIDRCMTFNNYILHESWYGGNEKKYAQRNINILLGKETELKEIPRVGSDKE